MCGGRLLLALMSSGIILSLNAKQARFDAAASHFETGSLSSFNKLQELGLNEQLKILSSTDISETEKTRLRSLYWAIALKDQKVSLDKKEEITNIPTAFNNVLENVVEFGWDKHVGLTDEEIATGRNTYKIKKIDKSQMNAEEKLANDKKPVASYVKTNSSGERYIVDLGDEEGLILYLKAQKIYKQALTDMNTVSTLDINGPRSDEEMLNISVAINSFLNASGELSLIRSMKTLTAPGQVDRAPASIGEHKDAHHTKRF